MMCVHICIRYKKEAPIGLNFLHNLLTHLDFYIACSQGGGGGVLGLVFCFGFGGVLFGWLVDLFFIPSQPTI